jgi:hypothetical protein
VVDLGQHAVAELLDVVQGAPNEQLDVCLLSVESESAYNVLYGSGGFLAYLGSVGNVLALLDLQLHIEMLPVVGHGEHGIRAANGLDNGCLVIDIGLE